VARLIGSDPISGYRVLRSSLFVVVLAPLHQPQSQLKAVTMQIPHLINLFRDEMTTSEFVAGKLAEHQSARTDQFIRNYSLERSTSDAYCSWDATSGKVTKDATAVL
jgi:hypothetical protein